MDVDFFSGSLGVGMQVAHHKKQDSRPRKKRYQHEWLSEDDPANVEGYWVPSPEEIREQCERLKSGEIIVNGNSGKLMKRLRQPHWCVRRIKGDRQG